MHSKPKPHRRALPLLLLLLSAQMACAYYDPGLQRWINMDPVGERDAPNLFRFSTPSPVNTYDCWGLESATFYRTTIQGNVVCNEICYCDDTEFLAPPDLKPVPLPSGRPTVIDTTGWISFRLAYPEWTGDGCNCVYYGWKGDAFLERKIMGRHGLVSGPVQFLPPAPPVRQFPWWGGVG